VQACHGENWKKERKRWKSALIGHSLLRLPERQGGGGEFENLQLIPESPLLGDFVNENEANSTCIPDAALERDKFQWVEPLGIRGEDPAASPFWVLGQVSESTSTPVRLLVHSHA
jgi:hypothetical protein